MLGDRKARIVESAGKKSTLTNKAYFDIFLIRITSK